MKLFTINEHGADLCKCEVFLDASSLVVTFPGEDPVQLTDIESRILLELMRAKGAPVSAEHLVRKIWNGYATKNALSQRVKSLRSKIGDDKVLSVYGYGYRFNL